ncbi:hypothetical protein [Streptomyces coelicoflavus]|uniref:hypothetical protein n=1 Tax=Streptomyces coelicoflavus TaxID=285562 RepID=UPI003F49FC67
MNDDGPPDQSDDVVDDRASLVRHDDMPGLVDELGRGQHMLRWNSESGKYRGAFNDVVRLERGRASGDHLLQQQGLHIRRTGKKTGQVQPEQPFEPQKARGRGIHLQATEERGFTGYIVGEVRILPEVLDFVRILTGLSTGCQDLDRSKHGLADRSVGEELEGHLLFELRGLLTNLPELLREPLDRLRETRHSPLLRGLYGRVLQLPVHHTVGLVKAGRTVVLGDVDYVLASFALDVVGRHTLYSDRGQIGVGKQ